MESDDDYEFQTCGREDLKRQAVEYYQKNKVPQKIEEVLNNLFYDQPSDIYGYLVNFFQIHAKPPTLCRMHASPVLDSEIQPAIQIKVYCTINGEETLVTSIMVCSFNSQSYKSSDIEIEESELDRSIELAINYINKELNLQLKGLNPAENQSDIDSLLKIFSLKLQPETDKQLFQRKGTEAYTSDDAADNDFEKERRGSKANKQTASKKSAKVKCKTDVVLLPDTPIKKWAPGTPAGNAVSFALCYSGAVLKKIPFYDHIYNLTDSPKELDFKYQLPVPMVTLIQCGKLTIGKVNTLKEIMILPPPHMSIKEFIIQLSTIRKFMNRSIMTHYAKWAVNLCTVSQLGAITLPFDKPELAMDFLLQVTEHAGYIAGKDFFFAINCAAHETLDREKGVYEYVSGSQFKSIEEAIEFWTHLLKSYPSICALIDPFRKQEGFLWKRLCKLISDQCLVIGDFSAEWPFKSKDIKDSVVKETESVEMLEGSNQETKAQENYIASGQVFRIQQDTTITDMIEYTKDYKANGYHVIISGSQREVDSWLKADLAVGLQATFLKTGGLFRKERTDILNRLFNIEQKLIEEGRLIKQWELWKYPKLFSESLMTL